MSAPSGFAIERAMAAWQSGRAAMLASDPDEDPAQAIRADDGDIMEILSRLLMVANEAAVLADGASEMIRGLKSRQDKFKRRSEQCRNTAQAVMEALGRNRVEFAHCTASIRAGKPHVVITDEDALEDRFVRIKREPDKRAIMTAFEDGEVITGAELSNSAPILQVRNS